MILINRVEQQLKQRRESAPSRPGAALCYIC